MFRSIIILIMTFTIGTSLFAQNHFTVEVTDLSPDKGAVYLGLYNKELGFLSEGAAIANARVKTVGNKISFTFKNLPKGEYAVAVYQDKNNNGKCDRNMIGYPLEGYGFSRNYKPKFSAPKFSEVKISVRQSTSTTIALIGN